MANAASSQTEIFNQQKQKIKVSKEQTCVLEGKNRVISLVGRQKNVTYTLRMKTVEMRQVPQWKIDRMTHQLGARMSGNQINI